MAIDGERRLVFLDEANLDRPESTSTSTDHEKISLLPSDKNLSVRFLEFWSSRTGVYVLIAIFGFIIGMVIFIFTTSQQKCMSGDPNSPLCIWAFTSPVTVPLGCLTSARLGECIWYRVKDRALDCTMHMTRNRTLEHIVYRS